MFGEPSLSQTENEPRQNLKHPKPMLVKTQNLSKHERTRDCTLRCAHPALADLPNPPTSLSVERVRLMILAYPPTYLDAYMPTYLHTYILTYLHIGLSILYFPLHTYILGEGGSRGQPGLR